MVPEASGFAPAPADSRNSDGMNHHQDGSVFVDVVQFTDDPNVIGGGPCGISFVWLRLADSCDLRRGITKDALELSESRTVFEFRAIVKNRKLNLSENLGVCANWLCHRVRDVIQGRARLMNHVTDHDSVLNLWLKRIGAKYQVPLFVHMGTAGCGAVYSASTDTECGFEIKEKSFGPFQFLTDRFRRIAHRNTPTIIKKKNHANNETGSDTDPEAQRLLCESEESRHA
jgi:hypothetical protein